MHFLCEVQFESKEFRERIDKFGVDQANWRVVPVGYDALGNAYWLFDDCRLYCESPIADPDSYYHYEPLELDDNGSYIMNEPAPEMDIIDNSHSLSKDSSDTKDSATTDPRDESHAIKKITGLDSLDELPSSCATVTNSPPHKSTGFKIKLKNLKKSSIPQSWSLVF